jgi:uncharacterized delta-60 repeat protein
MSRRGLLSGKKCSFRPQIELLEERWVPNAADLDASFGVSGLVTTDLGGTDEIFAVAVQTDGSIVAAGRRTLTTPVRSIDIAVVQYTLSGGPDTSFGVNGAAYLDLGDADVARAVAIQADGKIVVAGSAFRSFTHDFIVARFNTDGSLDTSFGTGGYVATDFLVSAASNDFAYGLTIQPDGKIIAVGSTQVVGSNFGFFGVTRYNTDGTPDTSFDGDGKIAIQIGGGAPDRAQAVALQGDGKIVVAGVAELAAITNFGVARLNPNGSLDTTFGSGGAVMTDIDSTSADEARAVAIQADGKIVVAGETFKYPTRSFALARYNTNGSLDTTFDGDGKVITGYGTGTSASAYGLGIQANGRIVAAGFSSIGGATRFTLIRHSANGALDASFGAGGKVATNFSAGAVAYALAIQPDGKLVAGGISGTDFALARYMGDPTADPPVADAGGPYSVPDGGFVQLNASGTTDPDQNPTTLVYQWDLDGDGVYGELFEDALRGDEVGRFPTFSAVGLDGDGSYTVHLRVTDAGLLTSTDTATINLSNVAPAVSAGGNASIDEGGTLARNGSFTDPGADSWTATVDYGDGGGAQSLTLNANKTYSLSHVYADDGSYTVTVTVTDDEGDAGTASFMVSVGNTTPVVSAGADTPIDEGGTLTRSGAFTDPGADSWSATVDYGDGGGAQSLALNANKTFSLSHVYADNGSYTVTVTVTDDEGAAGSASFTVAVANETPVVSVGADTTIDEGGTLARNGSFADPGDDSWSAIVDYGDGSGVQSLPLNSDKTFSLNHVYADDGDFTVTVTVTDDDGDAGSATFVVTVHNVDPTVSAGGNASLAEGVLFTRAAAFTDPGADSWSATVNYGDGGGNQSLALNADKSFDLSHTFADNGVYTVTVTVADDDGGIHSASFDVSVVNVAPSVSLTGPASGVRGQTLIFTGSFADPGADGWSATVNFGDGGGNQTLTLNADKTFQLSKIYSVTGNYTITVTVQDDDGDGGSSSLVVPIRVVDVQDDPLNPGQSLLAVGGTTQADKIQVNPGSSAGAFVVKFGNSTFGTFSAPAGAPFGRIAVFGLAGDDDITIGNSITLPAWLEGHGGNDKLRGGAGNDVLRGGAGDDSLYGNAGRDLLIAGLGADRLEADGEENIYLAGTTSFDDNDAALMAIWREWTSSRSRAVRIANLTDGSGSADRANGAYFLVNGVSVFQDSSVDDLIGTTSIDWLFYDAARDRLRR